MSLKEESIFIPSEKEEIVEVKSEEVLEVKSEHIVEVKSEEVVEVKSEHIVEVKSEEVVEVKSEEVVEEIFVGVELNDVKKSLNDLFLNIINSYDEKNNYFTKIGVQLSEQTIDIIKKIIENNKTLLDEIEKGLLEVLKDNKIDASDIPQFILIVQILYERISNTKDLLLNPSKSSEICLIILKFIIHTLVEERKIIIQEEKKIEFLSQLDKLIESCISLLNFPNLFKTHKNCCTIM